MTLTIDASVGGASANSFVTEAEQVAYMAARLNSSAWTTFSGSSCTEQEKSAMIEAARDISIKDYKGARATSTQALSWPRWFVVDPDAPTWGYIYFQQTVIPQRVKNAQMELAFQYLNLGTVDAASLDPTIQVTHRKVDVLETQYAEPWQRPRGLARWPRVLDQLRPLLASSSTSTPILRG